MSTSIEGNKKFSVKYLDGPSRTCGLAQPTSQMKIGGNIYCDGARMGEIIFISAMAYPDSQNPLLLSTAKATQFSIVVDTVLPKIADSGFHHWEVGNLQSKRKISVVSCNPEGPRTKMVVDLPSI